MSEANGQSNGSAAPAAAPPGQDKRIEVWLEGVMLVLLKGAIGTALNVPPGVIVVAMCRVLGKLISENYRSDDLGYLAKFRQECRAAFREGIGSAPPRPLGSPTVVGSDTTAPK